jgi:hypothetical protein
MNLRRVVSARKTFSEGHNAAPQLRISMKIFKLLVRNLKNIIFGEFGELYVEPTDNQVNRKQNSIIIDRIILTSRIMNV